NRLAQTPTAGTCHSSQTAALANNRAVGYTYDAAGNITNDGQHSYTYDAENRIIAVDGGNTTYTYDAQDHRVTKTTGGSWRNYLYDMGDRAVAETTASGWQVGYAYLGGQLLAQYRDSTTYFVHHDHLGSTRLLTGAGPSTRIQSTGGAHIWKYYFTGLCPGVSGVTYTVSAWIKNQGTTSVKVSGNIVDGPVIAP